MHSPAIHRDFAAALLLSAGVLVGCSSYDLQYTPAAELGTQQYREELAVLAQICVPVAMAPERLVVQHVARYGDHGEMRSSGSTSPTKRVGGSTSNVVFEAFTYRRQLDLVVLFIRTGNIEYLYDLKGTRLSTENWTSGQPPVSRNSTEDMVWYKLANQRAFEVRPPESTAPKTHTVK